MFLLLMALIETQAQRVSNRAKRGGKKQDIRISAGI